MIAYKTFSQCKPQDRPPGVLLTFPWIERSCTEEEATELEEQGYTVVTQETYDALVASLTAANQVSLETALIRDAVLTPAITFGQEIIVLFAAENIRMGITQAGMTTTVRAVTADIVSALNIGSLYDAILAAQAVPDTSYDPTFVTAARLLEFVNKIEDYLGIPRSTGLD